MILDVVYNHSGEGNHLGPTLSFRGIDNASYYRLKDGPAVLLGRDRHRQYIEPRSPRVLQLIMDSLRYWASEMHVDGFRFDLCTTWDGKTGTIPRAAPFSTRSARTRSWPGSN